MEVFRAGQEEVIDKWVGLRERNFLCNHFAGSSFLTVTTHAHSSLQLHKIIISSLKLTPFARSALFFECTAPAGDTAVIVLERWHFSAGSNCRNNLITHNDRERVMKSRDSLFISTFLSIFDIGSAPQFRFCTCVVLSVQPTNFPMMADSMSKAGVTVVLGGQWGDEGKGKLVDILAQDADVVARCQVGS